MIEYNANGIAGFAMLVKKFFTWLIVEGKEFLVYLGMAVIANVESVRQWVKRTIHQYLYAKDLSSKELNKQIKTLNTIMKVLQTVIGLFFVRYMFITLKRKFF